MDPIVYVLVATYFSTGNPVSVVLSHHQTQADCLGAWDALTNHPIQKNHSIRAFYKCLTETEYDFLTRGPGG